MLHEMLSYLTRAQDIASLRSWWCAQNQEYRKPPDRIGLDADVYLEHVAVLHIVSVKSIASEDQYLKHRVATHTS
jgi:hypothetical protein